jgi:ribosomal protein L37AE/L43A
MRDYLTFMSECERLKDLFLLEAEEEKPLPCPVCGTETTYRHVCGLAPHIECMNCGATVFGTTREEAIAKWNRRAK